jgi:hypothetical protein
MLMFFFGLPNHFTEWCEALILKLAERTSGSLLFSNADSSEELLQVMVEHPSQPILVSQRQPGNWLHRILGAANGRCIVALADPRACVAEIATGPGGNLTEIVCRVANSCATLTSYLSLPGALVLRMEEDSFYAAATARKIADHLQLPTADDEIQAALDAISLPDRNALVTATCENLFDESKLALINGALGGYAECFTGAPLGQLVWVPDLFIVGDTHQRVNGPIDITGRIRCLIFGPYIRLPPGRWTVDVAVAFTELGGSKNFTIDVANPVRLHEVSINVVDQGGVYTSLTFVLDPTQDSALEVRVIINQAAFQGLLALGPVILRPQQDSTQSLLELLTTSSHARPTQ